MSKGTQMRIGIIGEGVVGGAVSYGMNMIGHEVSVYDPIKYPDSNIDDVTNTDIVFICVPTPSKDNGECDISIIEETVEILDDKNYRGIIAIKSTVVPGTTRYLLDNHRSLDICFVPEFLRERMAIADFTENHDLLVVGTDTKEVFEWILKAHGKYPKSVIMISPTESELIKYFNNIYNATLITLANSFYEVCEKIGADYDSVKTAITMRDHIRDIYLDVSSNIRGFGGMCLPKDTKAMDALCRRLDVDVEFFKFLLWENKKYPVTVFDGMRK